MFFLPGNFQFLARSLIWSLTERIPLLLFLLFLLEELEVLGLKELKALGLEELEALWLVFLERATPPCIPPLCTEERRHGPCRVQSPQRPTGPEEGKGPGGGSRGALHGGDPGDRSSSRAGAQVGHRLAFLP